MNAQLKPQVKANPMPELSIFPLRGNILLQRCSRCSKIHPLDRRLPVKPRFGHDFSEVGVQTPKSVMAQAGMRISQPEDSSEREADHLADMVMRMSEPSDSAYGWMPGNDRPSQSPGRKKDSDRAEYKAQPPMLKAKSSSKKTADTGYSSVGSLVPSIGAGQSLSQSLLSFFEPRFGFDFNQIRVHSGGTASEAARSVNARAFTFGRDIVFGAGEFSPWNDSGKRLLAHELSHIVQQRNGSMPHGIYRTPDEATARQSIIDEAGSLIGSHYLWAGHGELPARFSTPHVYSNSHCECAGRHSAVNLPHAPESGQVTDFKKYSWPRYEGSDNCGGSGCNASAGDQIWGEACDGKGHFDCGGFVKWCYDKAGISMKDSAIISRDNLQPGDVCERPGHVALFAGNNQVLEAQAHSTGVVRSKMGNRFSKYRTYFQSTEKQSSADQGSPMDSSVAGEPGAFVLSDVNVTAVACTCNQSMNVKYHDKTFDFLKSIKSLIDSSSRSRGVPALAVAGAIADEYDTRRGLRGLVDAIQDTVVGSLNEKDIDIDRFLDIHSKLLNALENDVGPANIKVRTALELVQRGELDVPGSPRSDIKVKKIIEFLLTERGTVETTAAVIARAKRLFGIYLRDHSEELAETVFVEYFKQGDSYYNRFLQRIKANPNHKICPGDDGCQFWYNRDSISRAITTGP